MNYKNLLQNILKSIELEKLSPAHIDLSIVGNRYWSVVRDEREVRDIMTEDVYTGLADSQELSLLKALSERIERLSYIKGYESKLKSCLTERSDGFAAMPKQYDLSHVRENALNEAIERYVWATWWDDLNIKHSVSELYESDDLVQRNSYLKWIFKELDLEKLIVIKPSFDSLNKEVQVVLGKIKDAGYISGGACGFDQESETIFLRSVDELLRHGLAFQKMKSSDFNEKTFYEKRLFHFASGEGNIIVRERLLSQASKNVVLPKLEIDEMIPSISEHYNVYRCLFKNQPAFVGGKLERLCL